MTVKEAPVRGLRAVFARFRGKGGAAPAKATPEKPAADAVGQGGNVKVVAPEAKPESVIAETATPSETQAAAQPESVIAETAEPEVTAEPESVIAETTVPSSTVAQAAAVKVTGPQPVLTEAPATAATPAPSAAAEPESVIAEVAEADLPLPRYDTLTVASLRARLRTLTPVQLTVLIGYEKAHQGREEVIGMFERRIVKIKAGETTSFQAVS